MAPVNQAHARGASMYKQRYDEVGNCNRAGKSSVITLFSHVYSGQF